MNHSVTEKILSKQYEVMLPYSLSEIASGLKSSVLIIELAIPQPIITEIAMYCMKEFKLKLDESMVVSSSAVDLGDDHSLEKLFMSKGTFCTINLKTEAEILLKLSTKNHKKPIAKKDDDNGFVITEIGIKGPHFGYSSPIETFIMWTFNDNIPNSKEIDVKYGGKIDIKTLQVYNVNDNINNKCGIIDSDGKCLVCLTDIHSATDRTKKKRLLLPNKWPWIKAKYVLIKLMASNGNVDTKRFWMKVMRL